MRGGNYVPSHVLVRSVTFRSFSLPSTLSVHDTLTPAVALAPQSAEFTSRTLPARCLEKNRMLISYDIIFYILFLFSVDISHLDILAIAYLFLLCCLWIYGLNHFHCCLFVNMHSCHFLLLSLSLSLSCHDCWALLVLILDLGCVSFFDWSCLAWVIVYPFRVHGMDRWMG